MTTPLPKPLSAEAEERLLADKALASFLTEASDDVVASWARTHKDELAVLMARSEALRERVARYSVNEFVEYVARDEETGRPIKQASVHRRMQALADRHERLVLWAHTEAGKAVPLDTPIPTPDGWTTMGELSPGDRVFGRDGRVCVVVACSPVQHERQVFEVEFEDGAVERADADHNWLVGDRKAGTSRHRDYRVRTTAEMVREGVKYRGANRWYVPVARALEHETALPLPVPAYVLGAWLGDGDSATATLTYHRDDAAVADRCRALVGGDCEPYADKRNPAVMRVVLGGFRSKKENYNPTSLRKRLRRLGVLGNKHIPAHYLSAPVHERRELLAGLLDTDGYVSSRGLITLALCNERLAADALDLIRGLGFRASMRAAPAKLDGRTVGAQWKIHFVAHEPVFHLPRKLARQRINPHAAPQHRAIVRIAPIASVPVRCIAVDSPDHTYVMGRSYTVTHNTNQLSILRVLHELGKNPRLRVCVVSDTQAQAQKIVRAQQAYIQHHEGRIQRVFPHLTRGEKWTTTAYDVGAARYGAKDYSVQAMGLGSGVLGARIDLLILDDVLTNENTRTERGRKEVEDWWRSTIAGRLTANARVIFVGNAWHPQDLMHTMERDAGWTAHRFSVLDERDRSTWPARWPTDRIHRVRRERGPLEFARSMLCIARDDATARFQRAWIERCLARGEGMMMPHRISAVPPGCRVYTGVDLGASEKKGSDLSVLFTVMVMENGDRRLLALDSGQWAAPEIVARIIDHHRRYHSIVVVESNAAQNYLQQFLKAGTAVPVFPFYTDAKKHDETFGVESLAVEMYNSKWIIPAVGGSPASPDIAEWITEMLFYNPAQHTGDRLMACWFAREALEGRVGIRRKAQKVSGLSLAR